MSEELELRPDLLRATPQSEVLDLTHLAEELDGPPAPPSLVEDPARLWPMSSGLHSSLLSTSTPLGSADAWQELVEELAAESRNAKDPQLRGAMLFEAGRILIERLGKREEGELLLKRSECPLAEVLEVRLGDHSSLATELAELEATARDESQPAHLRVAAWIEFGQLCEERTPSRKRALQAYQAALELDEDNPVALALATAGARADENIEAAIHYLRRQVDLAKSDRHKVALLLDLADLLADPQDQLAVLEQAHQCGPREEAVLRRLSRALAALGDRERLGELYRELARVAEDPISASTALHLAFLTWAEEGHDVSELVLELAERSPEHGDDAEVLAPLAEVALYVEQHISSGGDPAGLPENLKVLSRLSRALDDPREQALVREQLARIRLAQLRRELDTKPAPADTATGLPKLDEARTTMCDNLEADLRFCLVHLPEHRWVREALAEVLELRGNQPALVLHLQEWARTQSAGPGRAAILLRLGTVHEERGRDLARAAEIYELAVAEDPDNPNCLRAVGRVYEKMRRWPQAVAALRRQAKESDDLPERLAALRRVASLAEHELGDIDLAISALEEVAQRDPDDLLTLYQLATLCRKARRPTVLISALEQLCERVDDDVARTAVLVELGEVQELHLKQRAAARTCYERALQLTPGYTPALRALGRLYRDNGDLDGLIGLLDPKVDTVTDPAVLALKAGRVCFEEIGDVERAIEHLQTAYETNPDLVPARELLLQLLTASGKIERAYDLLRAQDPPKSPSLCADYHYRLGLLAEASARGGEPRARRELHPLEDAALQHYRAALAQQSDHGLAYERSRRLLVAHNDNANLARLIENLVPAEHAVGRSVLHVHLSRLHVAGGDTAIARRAYEEALAAAPDDAIVRHEFEGLLRLLGDRKSLPALYLRGAKDTEDTHLKATLLVEAAELLLSTGEDEDYDVAGRAILQALQVDPGNPYAVRHLERLLSDPDSPFVVKDAVSARAVRAQSDAERAIFYVESAELLERVGAWGQARRAYLAAKSALPTLAPAELGLQRTTSEKRRTAAATSTRTSVHVLVAEAREATVAAGRGDEAARQKALTVVAEVLQRDAHNRDAIAIARTLAGQPGDAEPVIELLKDTFRRLDNLELQYELGLFLGEHAVKLDEAVRYYQAASAAKPHGRRALRGLVNAYRQMGDDRQAAAATERLLELFEPGEPSAIDLRMGIANFLSANPETLPRALEHARVVLQARPDDARAIGLMADLLERSDKQVEAAQLLDRLVSRERNRERLHDIYLRKAKLLADVPDQGTEALAAIERAAALSPGNRDTITLLIEQLSRVGQTARVATYLPPIRSALQANIARGAVSLRDLNLLSKVAAPQNEDLSQMARVLLAALEPGGTAVAKARVASATGWRRLLGDAAMRRNLYADGETAHLHALLQAVDGVVARLPREFPGLGGGETGPIPAEATAKALVEHARHLADVLGLRAPRLGTSSTHNAALLQQDPICTIRLGANLWNQGEPDAWRGLLALGAARWALGAARARALSPPNLDLLIAACFEVVDVFNPTTAEPDPHKLRDLVTNLGNVLPRRQTQSGRDRVPSTGVARVRCGRHGARDHSHRPSLRRTAQRRLRRHPRRRMSARRRRRRDAQTTGRSQQARTRPLGPSADRRVPHRPPPRRR